MINRYWLAATAVVSLACAAFASAAPIGTAVTPPCDRACMSSIIDRYLAALVRHDPAGLPLNRDVKFTENGARLKVVPRACGLPPPRHPPAFGSTPSMSAPAKPDFMA
jgi:hypothetical protein